MLLHRKEFSSRTLVGLGIVYFALALISIQLSREGIGIAIVWLPNAVLVAVFNGVSWKKAAVFAAIAFPAGIAANMFHGDSLATAAGLASANYLEIVLAHYLMTRLADASKILSSLGGLVRGLLIPSIVAPVLGGAVGATVVQAAYGADWVSVFKSWYIADMVSFAILIPVVLVTFELFQGDRRHAGKLSVSSPIAFGISAAIGGSYMVWAVLLDHHGMVFLVLPLFIAFSLYLGRPGVAGAASSIILAVLVESVAGGNAIQSHAGLDDPVLDLQFFLLVCALPGFVITASLEERATAFDAAKNASRAKSEFIANMSHEIRTPLNAVMGMLQILDLGPVSDRQRKQIGVALEASENLYKQLSDVLDISRIEASGIQPMPVEISLKDHLEKWRDFAVAAAGKEGKSLAIETALLGTTATMVTDPDRLTQIMSNLIANAAKFTSAGSISLTASTDDVREVGRFTVTDTGDGISPENLVHVFDRFTQADSSVTRTHGGSGLGLYIAAKLTELLGGTISATSRVGVGSEFVVEIPLRPSAALEPDGALGS